MARTPRVGSYRRTYVGTHPVIPPDGAVLVHDGFGAPRPDDDRSGEWWHQRFDERLVACACDAGCGIPHYLVPRKVTGFFATDAF